MKYMKAINLKVCFGKCTRTVIFRKYLVLEKIRIPTLVAAIKKNSGRAETAFRPRNWKKMK